MHNDKLVNKVVILVRFGISIWKEKEALRIGHHSVPVALSQYFFRIFAVIQV